jgi:hypothetical protein
MHYIQLGTLMPNRLGKRSPSHQWSGRVENKVPSPIAGVRAAQLNR